MICISCDNICFAIGIKTVLDGVTFSINEGDRLGIVGVNGAGKSTLLRILTGEYEASGGAVYISKGKSVRILDQNVTVEGSATVSETMLGCFPELLECEEKLSLLEKQMHDGSARAANDFAVLHDKFVSGGGYEFRGRCTGILRSLGFSESDLDLKVSALSGGQKTRLALGRILYSYPEILILDEPTNHLDMKTLRWLEEFLKGYRKTVIVVSHDRYFLDQVTNKILNIENHKAILYDGNYSAFIDKKKKDREIQERHYKNQQREIARIEAYIEQQRRWNRERNIIAAESREKMLDRMVLVEKPDNDPQNIRMRLDAGLESGNDVLKLKRLAKTYGDKNLFSNLSLLLKKKDHLLIIGGNGSGKSTLLKILTGKITQDSGMADFGYNLTIGYYDQENQQLNDENTVLDELWDAYEKLTQTEVRNALALFRFTGDDIQKKVSVLSGGERARLTLAKLVLSKSNLLILDEPTNHLDIGTREVLEDALSEYTGTIIAVSHDRYFISKLATRILDFDNKTDGAPTVFEGSFAEYQQFTGTASSKTVAIKETEEISDAKKKYIENKKAASDERRLEHRKKSAREEASKIESELDNISNEIETGDPGDYVRIVELLARKEELEGKLLELYEELDSLGEEV